MAMTLADCVIYNVPLYVY